LATCPVTRRLEASGIWPIANRPQATSLPYKALRCYNPRSMRIPRGTLATLMCGLLAASSLAAQKKKDKEEVTQVRRLPEQLPSAVVGDTHRLAFHTTPLSGKGLLSPQVRDALKALQHEATGETVLKIRAFVAGSADLRRVRDLVSEFYTSHKEPLPAITLVQAGGLPLDGAQVVLEAITAAKRDLNPYGMAFLSPTAATGEDPLGPVPPLTEQTLAGLRQSLQSVGLAPQDAVRVTCFVSSLQNLAESRRLVVAEYPRAALDFVQINRAPRQAVSACEAVARLRAAPPSSLDFIKSGAGESQIALVNTPQVVLTGAQDSFGYQEPDARLAFERLKKSLEQAGATAKNVAYAHYYPLSPSLGAEVRKVRVEFFDHPAATMLIFEGLPSMDAGFAVDVVAVK
jgi:enamine deaminase RidA (YjgF/YER057c/UK114 family)